MNGYERKKMLTTRTAIVCVEVIVIVAAFVVFKSSFPRATDIQPVYTHQMR